jgi:hypothetical protein
VDDGVILRTRLVHTSGQWLEGTYPVSKFAKHQEMGAALTYAKRQALFAVVGVCGDEDDDGNEAQKVDTRPAKKPEPTALSPEESATVLAAMDTSLSFCDSLASLEAWAKANTENKARLLPEHQDRIMKAKKDKQAAIRNPPMADAAE